MAEKSKTTLASDITTNLANASDITAAELRTVLGDVLDSVTATLKTTGAGTNYTLTGASALVDFGTTDPAVSMPGAGTFLILATLQVQADAAGANDDCRFKLRNTTDGADVGFERQVTMPANSALLHVEIVETVTVAAAKTIQLWGYNATSARGTVISTKTEIKSVRLA
jgi:hypothetical protein